MNIEDFRLYCLSLGEVDEKMPFGRFAAKFDSLLVFYVMGHMFCMIDINNFTHINVKSTPDTIAELRRLYSGIEGAANKTMRDWIALPVGGEIPEPELLRLVRESYCIIRDKYTKKPSRKTVGKRKGGRSEC